MRTKAIIINNNNNMKQPSANTSISRYTIIDLPVHDSSGIAFAGCPPKVSQLIQQIPHVNENEVVGYYFHALQILPGLEVSNVYDTNRLHQLLMANQHLPRKLVLSPAPPTIQNDGCHYKHDLPTGEKLGIQFTGFPAQVGSVDPSSPFAGKIHPGQHVDSVIVPGQPVLTVQSGGFTGARIQECLEKHAYTEKKQIILKDQTLTPSVRRRKHTNTDPFDLGGCTIS